MSKAILQKTPRGRRNVANASGAVLTNNGQVRLDLNKDFLVGEHQINVSVAQSFTGVPTSSDVRRFFSKAELVSNEGTIFTCDFHQLYDQSRFTEMMAFPIVSLAAASTAQFSFNLHHNNDESLFDILSALQTANFSTLALLLTVSPDAQNGFIGGTVPLAATYTIGVDSKEFPNMSLSDRAARNAQVYGKARHYFKAMAEKAASLSAASNQEVLLESGGRTRFVFLHSYNTTAAIPVLANGIVDKISLSLAGVDYMGMIDFKNLQQENIAQRGFNQVGVAVIDMGENPKAWIPMENINEAKLKYSTLGTAPAGWKVTVGQDFTVGLRELGVDGE